MVCASPACRPHATLAEVISGSSAWSVSASPSPTSALRSICRTVSRWTARTMPIALRPHRDVGGGKEDAGVASERQTQGTTGELRETSGHEPRQRAERPAKETGTGRVRGGTRKGDRREAGQCPGAEVHRRQRLEDAKHVMKPVGTAQIGDQERGAGHECRSRQVVPSGGGPPVV